MSDKELLDFGLKYMSQVEGFIKNNHYKLVDLKEHYCVMKAEVRDESLNPYGMVHGGFLFGLADTAAGIAAPSTGRKAVTLNANIEYLHAAYGSYIKAVAKAIKIGKTISVYEVLLYDDKEVMVAKASVDYFFID